MRARLSLQVVERDDEPTGPWPELLRLWGRLERLRRERGPVRLPDPGTVH